ncbi:hypothetical protein EX895_002639 [Sporisorium graminicola]|uniref:Peptidase M23 domain-containing protein n=1 Tax=Sporisorium graminicola TaxID=280036 RepID=A0A4U7KVV1_9BASI|nr:hypothetical protein EX895_002639 [Sporisorium graminicola]TKY88287.1 hypothetical protein EX895_002639 [Sporisorium graminicola]
MVKTTTLLLLLWQASACLAGSKRPHRQIPFSYPTSSPTPASSFDLAYEEAQELYANAAYVEDDDPSPVPSLRLSHSGLYINQAHPPSVVHRPDHSNQTDPFQPQPLVVHFDPTLYGAASAKASLGPVRLRTRDQVMLHCGKGFGGIEACERDDLNLSPPSHVSPPISHPAEPAATWIHAATSALDCEAGPQSLLPDGRFHLDERSCPGWSKYWQSIEQTRKDSSREVLQSFVVTVKLDKLPSSDETTSSKGDKAEQHVEQFWVGHLHLQESRASWPLAGNARDRRPGQEDRTWHPDDVNRIAGAMENPLIPKSSRYVNDRNFGVFVDQSAWTLGVQIKIPMSITNPRDDDQEDAKKHPEHVHNKLKTSMVLPPEEVFAPVSGQVVWAREYVFRRPPIYGPAAGDNDEASFCLMIRDEWSIVYQIFGIDQATVTVQEGETVLRGDVLGHALREGLSIEPPSTEPPADHATFKPDQEVSYYPYRYRTLQVRVSRPDPSWDEWKGPDEEGWRYFHPLHAFTEGKDYRSAITPYGSPTIVYFAKPSTDPLNIPPNAYATSNDFWTPTLQGPTEIIVGYEYFQQTPGDPGDGMDNLAIYALDIAFKKKLDGQRAPQRGMECDLGGETDPSGTAEQDKKYWRNVFEHAKLPNNWSGSLPPASATSVHATATANANATGTVASAGQGNATVRDDPGREKSYRWTSKLFSHYVAAFSYGRFFPEKITSQFDEKEKRLYYSAARTVRGEPKIDGAFNVQSIIDQDGEDGGRGKYRLVVRARDYWGNVGCIASDVMLT